MFWLNLKRVLKTGFVSFWRNGFVSLSGILVMIVTLFVIGFIVFSSALLTQAKVNIENQVDINVNFEPFAEEADVLDIKSQLESLPEVEKVEYLSKDDVLSRFIDNNRNDQKILDAIEELGENPFGPALNVKAKQPSEYEGVANFLNSNYSPDEAGSIVDELSFNKNKTAIDRLNIIIDAGGRLGVIIAIIFITIAIVISLNTVRLAMYISRNEIGVMQLVGASHSYISGPFIVAGAMYGIVSALLTLLLFLPFTYWLGDATDVFFGLNLFNYYTSNFAEMFLIIFFSGILIGAISSQFAIKRYLKKGVLAK
jgi:cell division transport system permease protein